MAGVDFIDDTLGTEFKQCVRGFEKKLESFGQAFRASEFEAPFVVRVLRRW
jgi:hypothetical protein